MLFVHGDHTVNNAAGAPARFADGTPKFPVIKLLVGVQVVNGILLPNMFFFV